MIDIKKAKQEFENYVANYNPEDIQIKLKIDHIRSVTDVARKIAIDLNLDEEDIDLAELIALLHDIGRFEQVKQYHTFSDRDSINHGEYGVKILKDGLIRKFIETSEYDDIIYTAILNHNRSKIESGLDERTKLHCCIVRDADKVDIFNVILTQPLEAAYNGCEDMSKEVITDKIYSQFLNERYINYPDMRTNADSVVSHCAYIFDINFKLSLKIIKENNYIEKLIDRMNFENQDTINKFQNIKNIVNEYIKNKLNG